MAYIDGPYVQLACFCDQIIEDKTGALSLIRIIDTIFRNASGLTTPEEMQPFQQTLTLVLALKSGAARGRNDLTIIPELPNGSTKDPLLFTIHFEGEERGSNIILQINYLFEYEGLYWFQVKLGEQLLTAIPLRVRYNRTMTMSGQNIR